MKLCLFVCLFCVAPAAFAEQQIRVDNQQLRVVLDTRLDPSLVETEWASGSPRSESPAVLELVGIDGRVQDRLVLAAPLAKINPSPVKGAPYPTYLVSADLTREAGSYNGPLTVLIQVVKDHLVEAIAQSVANTVEPVHLVVALKADWKKVTNRNTEDFLQVNCQPKGNGFITTYRRYFLKHGKWNVRMYVRPGFWESEGDFPRRNLFP